MFWSIIFLIACLITVVYSISIAIYYHYLYANLHRNFKQYMTDVDRKYVEVDVILHNAVSEAIDQAKEKNNNFELKAYTELFNKIKGKW